MRTDDLTIRAKVLDGVWETVGSERSRRIVPEAFTATANEWGSNEASFTLRRKADVPWPDLAGGSPMEAELGGVPIWAGRILETPTGDDALNVQARGWQYHLDDGSFAKAYVHTDLSAWRDPRSVLGTDQANFPGANGMAQSDDGAWLVGWSNGQYVEKAAGIMLDLGPQALGKRIAITYKVENTSGATLSMYVRGSDVVDVHAGGAGQIEAPTSPVALPTGSVAATTFAQTFTTAKRYLSIFLWRTPGTGFTLSTGQTAHIRITDIKVFGDQTLDGGAGLSLLTADKVLRDLLNYLPGLSTDTTRITAADLVQNLGPSFLIPELHFELEPRSPREVANGVNAFHNYLLSVDPDRRLVFRPRPSSALFEVGAWPGAVFEDASLNSIDEVVNRAMTQATTAAGDPVLVQRASGGLPDAKVLAFFDNTYSGAGLSSETVTIVRAVKKGVPVVIQIGPRVDGLSPLGAPTSTWSARVGADPTEYVSGTYGPVDNTVGSDPAALTLVYVPTADRANITILMSYGATMTSFRYGIQARVGTTLPDRLGFAKDKTLTVGANIPDTAAARIADIYLAAHKTQPLRGTLTAQPGGVRDATRGTRVHPGHMLLACGELVRFADRTDPDNGAHAREGAIASVSYDHDTRTGTVAIDSERRNLEAVLARYGALAGR